MMLQRLWFLLRSLLELWSSLSVFSSSYTTYTSYASGEWNFCYHEIFPYELFCKARRMFLSVRHSVSFYVAFLRWLLINQLMVSRVVNSFSTDSWWLCLAVAEQTVSVGCRCWSNLNQGLLQWVMTTRLTTSTVRRTSQHPAKHRYLLNIRIYCLQ